MSPSGLKINVFDYTDYRKYLWDYYVEQKDQNKFFSYRYFAHKAGINSVGLYKDVVDGRQCLGRGLILKFSTALAHTKREADYFEAMVYFNESRTVEERKLYFQRMMSCYDSKAFKIDASRAEYYSKWYYSAVRALLSYYQFDGDYAKLGKILVPPITAKQAEKSVALLEKLGFIEKNADGVYQLTNAVITTGILKSEPQLHTMNVVNYQRTMMEMAAEAYDLHEWNNLDFSTLTLSISEETFKAMKSDIISLRKKFASMAEKDIAADRVYQLNYQFWPMTRGKDSGHKGSP